MITALERIAKEISENLDSRARACLTAKRATYLAREGFFPAAREVSGYLRKVYQGSEFLELTCWLCLLDGIILFHEFPDSDSFDRIRRSYELSRIISKSEVAILSGAWLAQIEFNRGNIIRCCSLSAEALLQSKPNHFGILSRIALTVADCFHYCMKWDEALKWYKRAREQAYQDGDRTAVSATMHNLAAMGISVYRFNNYFNPEMKDACVLLNPAINSSRNYDELLNNQTLVSLEPINRFKLLVGELKFDEALKSLSVRVDDLSSGGLRRYTAGVLADKLLCQIRIGIKIDNLSDSILFIEEALKLVVDRDDRAIVYRVLFEIASTVGDDSIAEFYRREGLTNANEHKAALATIIGELERLNINYLYWSDIYGNK